MLDDVRAIRFARRGGAGAVAVGRSLAPTERSQATDLLLRREPWALAFVAALDKQKA